MADKSVIFTLIGKDAASGAIKGVTGSLHGLKGAAGGVTGAISGVGGALLSLPSLIVGGGVIAGLTMMTKSAADDAAAQSRLTAAVKAAIPAWNGNTDALNAAIAASQNKGFADDEARDSLVRLIRSTKDVNEATKLNALAMDLARLKGIPLADAANLIAKAHDGQFTALNKAGIAIDKNATATQALATIQALAAGQADTYANSEAGGAKRMGIGFAELGESVGSLFLPVMQGAVGLLNDQLIPALNGVVGTVQSWIGNNQQLIGDIGTAVSGTFTQLGTILKNDIIPAVTGIGSQFAGFINVVVTKVVPVLLDLAERVWRGGLGDAIRFVAGVAGDLFGALASIFTTITSNQDVMNVLRVAADLLGAGFGVVAQVGRVVWQGLKDIFGTIGANQPVMSALNAVVTGIWTGLQSIAGWLVEIITPFVKFFENIASNQGVMDVFRGVIDALGAGLKVAFDALDAFWQTLQALWSFITNNPVASVLGTIGDLLGGGDDGGGSKPGAASGGAIFVGENGPETFVPFTSGLILPNGVGPTGGGGNLTLNVNVTGPAVFDPQGIAAQQLAEMLIPGLRRGLTRMRMSLA